MAENVGRNQDIYGKEGEVTKKRSHLGHREKRRIERRPSGEKIPHFGLALRAPLGRGVPAPENL